MAFVTTGFITFVTVFWSILPFVAVLDLIGVITILFVDRLNPRSFVFWLMLIIIFPIGGLLLYLAFGNHFYSDRYFRAKLDADMPYIDDPVDMDGDNDVSLQWTREEFMESILADLAHVKESVWVEAPIIRDFTVWDPIMSKVADLAHDGLDVRVMTASFGFGRSHGVRRVHSAGGKFATFNNIFYALFSKRYRNRNLRMQMILDGDIVYTGISTTMRIEGPMASWYVRRFKLDWAHGKNVAREHVPVCRPDPRIRLLEDGRDSIDHGCSVRTMLDMSMNSKEYLYVCMPYLTPDEDMYNALKISAYAGADVRILLPAKTWYMPQKWNSLMAAYPLMKAGVRVYFVNDHSNRRITVSDDEVCLIGSATMNRMSLDNDLNLSTLVCSEDVCIRAREMFLRELDGAVECTAEEFEKRSFLDKIMIMASRFCMYMN